MSAVYKIPGSSLKLYIHTQRRNCCGTFFMMFDLRLAEGIARKVTTQKIMYFLYTYVLICVYVYAMYA